MQKTHREAAREWAEPRGCVGEVCEVPEEGQRRQGQPMLYCEAGQAGAAC